MAAHDDPKALGPARLGFADPRDVETFVETLSRFERGEIDGDAWRSFRLVHGVYSQRQEDAMMVRVKIPQGILTPAQLEALADVADLHGNGVAHVTTRQNVQLHFVAAGRLERALRRLAAAGLTTREACGNSVRNITGCPYAGTSATEPFDATPYADALTRYLLRGPLSSTLPRKFKIAFGGCCGTDCVASAINDMGFLARLRDGLPGFRLTVGGGTATMPRSGILVESFLDAAQVLEAAEAVVRIFDRIGNRKDRNRARLKFAIESIGVDRFLDLYRAEREAITRESGRPLVLPPAAASPELPQAPDVIPAPRDGFDAFCASNVRVQKQEGFSTVVVRLPLGDVTASQVRDLARIARRHGEGLVRTTHEQNVLLRYVAAWQLPTLHRALADAGLALPGARTIADVTSCPGASSCRLAVTASRGLAAVLTELLEGRPDLAALAPDLSIKVSGCPNGCGHHHIAGIGFQGGMRKVDGRALPQYHVLLGGGLGARSARFGRFAAKIPVRRAAAALERLLRLYGAERLRGESPEAFFGRVDLGGVRVLLADLADISPDDATAEDFVDLGESGAYKVEVSAGECAR